MSFATKEIVLLIRDLLNLQSTSMITTNRLPTNDWNLKLIIKQYKRSANKDGLITSTTERDLNQDYTFKFIHKCMQVIYSTLVMDSDQNSHLPMVARQLTSLLDADPYLKVLFKDILVKKNQMYAYSSIITYV